MAIRRRAGTEVKPRKKQAKSDDYMDDEDEYEEDDDDEYEEARPRRSKSSRRRDGDDDEEEDDRRPPRRTRRAQREDDDDDDRRPSKRRPRDDDDDDDDRPRRRKARSRDDDDDDDDRPRRSKAQGGWNTYDKNQQEASNFAPMLKLDDDLKLVYIMDDEPFWSYNQHWIERKGKKSFVCIGRESCPLCQIGDHPTTKNVFNVAVLEEGIDPVVMVLSAGKRLTEKMRSKAKKQGGLGDRYWGVARTGKGNTTDYDFNPIKERDLEDDWGVEELDDQDFKRLRKEAYRAEDVDKTPTRKELQEIAAEQVGDYEDD